jgi:hypothetical protein
LSFPLSLPSEFQYGSEPDFSVLLTIEGKFVIHGHDRKSRHFKGGKLMCKYQAVNLTANVVHTIIDFCALFFDIGKNISVYIKIQLTSDYNLL